MKRLSFAVGIILLLFLVVFIAIAARDRGTATGKMPPIPSQIQRLSIFAGNWEGDANMIYRGKTIPKFGLKHKNTILDNKWGVQVLESADIPNMGRYSAIDLLGYDSGGDKIHLFTISNLGDTHDHSGNWVSDTSLIMEYNGTLDGQPSVERLFIYIPNNAAYSFFDTVLVNNAAVNIFQAVMKKK